MIPEGNRPDAEMNKDREAEVLLRILSTPPDHKRNVKSDASPKKRGRPPKVKSPERIPDSRD